MLTYRSVFLLVVLLFCEAVSAQLPVKPNSRVEITLRHKSFEGVLVESESKEWVGVRQDDSDEPTWVPLASIQSIRALAKGVRQPKEAVEDFEADGQLPDDHEPIGLRIKVISEPAGDLVVVDLTARIDLPLSELEVVFLGGASADRLDGFVKTQPRRPLMLKLVAQSAFAAPEISMKEGQRRTFRLPVRLEPNAPSGVVVTFTESLPAANEAGVLGAGTLLESEYKLWKTDGNNVFSSSSLLDVEVQSIAHSRRFFEASDGSDKTIERLLRSGAEIRSDVKHKKNLRELEKRGFEAMREGTRDEVSEITVRGTIRFTDVSGRTHPVPFVRVEVWDENLFDDIKLASGVTNEAGEYKFTVPTEPDDLPDIYLLAQAESDIVEVTDVSTERVWAIDSTKDVKNDVPPGTTVTIDLTASNNEIQFPSNVAFEIFAAVDLMGRYVEQLGQSRPRKVRVLYPLSGDGSSYQADKIRMGGTDAHDWDNIHHEYAHHLQAVFGISNSPGGPHGFSQNLCSALGKDAGVRLAWGEAWATFFSVAMHDELNLATRQIPNLGDTRYTDTKPNGLHIEYDLEGNFGGGGHGEGNEVAVQRVLWDIFDSGGQESEQLEISSQEQLMICIADQSHSASDFLLAISQTLDQQQRFELGAICAAQQFSPTPTSPVDRFEYRNGPVPTFRWEVGANCSIGSSQKFVVTFFDSAGNVRFASHPIQGTAFTPSVAERDAIFSGQNGELRWVTSVTDHSNPASGPIAGQARVIIDAHTP